MVGVSEAQQCITASSAGPWGMGLSLPCRALLELRLRVPGCCKEEESECLQCSCSFLESEGISQSRHHRRTCGDRGLSVI